MVIFSNRKKVVYDVLSKILKSGKCCKAQQPANAPAPYRPSMPNTSTTPRPRWGPLGQIALQASSSGPEQTEIARLQAIIATMAHGPVQHAYNVQRYAVSPRPPTPTYRCSLRPGPDPSTVGFMGIIIPMTEQRAMSCAPIRSTPRTKKMRHHQTALAVTLT